MRNRSDRRIPDEYERYALRGPRGSRVGAGLVYVSTNFVFDGEKDEPYHEFDAPAPISVYGLSKLAGEHEALQAHPDCYIVRTAMIYDDVGRNFVNTMKRLMSERDTISVVDDQFGNPTYAPDLAAGILRLIRTHPPGTYHLTNRDSTSWFGWASEIRKLGGYDCDVQPTTAAEYQRAASPPTNGVMTSIAARDVQDFMPVWQDALRRCLA
ncbi:MAG: sugar nucleotide-binding protein [Thermomicrobiales bacterium]